MQALQSPIARSAVGRILVLADGEQAIALGDEPAVVQRVLGLEAEDRRVHPGIEPRRCTPAKFSDRSSG